jgi:putative ABC transport system substrate-binding protein
VAWPLTARAQQGERVRRIGLFINLSADDPEMSARIEVFRKGLMALGWMESSNLQIAIRQYGGDLDRIRVAAKEMVGLLPEVILAYGPPGVAALRLETLTIAIVFAPLVSFSYQTRRL